MFSLTKAAKEAGVAKSTISKALASGRLSGHRQEDGSYRIDPSELFRVYPRRTPEPGPPSDLVAAKQPGETPHPNPQGDQLLRQRVDHLAELLAVERERRADDQATIADLRKRLDGAEDRIRLLTDKRQPATQQRGLLSLLFRRPRG